MVSSCINYEIKRKSVSVIKFECIFTQIGGIAQVSLPEILEILFHLLQSNGEGMSEASFFTDDDLRNTIDRIIKLRIGTTHRNVDGTTYFGHKRFIRAKQASMTNSAPQNLSKNISTAFVGGHHTVRNQEGRSARVIGDDAKGGVASC